MPWIITAGFAIVLRADDRSRLTRKLHGKSHWMAPIVPGSLVTATFYLNLSRIQAI